MPDGSNVVCEADRGREEVLFLAYGTPCLQHSSIGQLQNSAFITIHSPNLFKPLKCSLSNPPFWNIRNFCVLSEHLWLLLRPRHSCRHLFEENPIFGLIWLWLLAIIGIREREKWYPLLEWRGGLQNNRSYLQTARRLQMSRLRDQR